MGWAGAALAGHSAFVSVAHDPLLSSFYSGTSNPSGPNQVNVSTGGTPGYLNGITGGLGGGSAGNLLITPPPSNGTLFVGIALHVTDAAGPSHSLSALDDPALGDIVADLNIGSGGDFPINEYAYSGAPSQYSAALAPLSEGESANGGQPFDILIVGTNTTGIRAGVWALVFSNEIGNLDGITALSVTDVGAVPEPGAAALSPCLLLLIRWRSRALLGRS
jgi:hypothetical protein